MEPAEIERVLMSHPRVREALVLAAEQPSGAQVPVAYVAGERVPDEAELTEWGPARCRAAWCPAACSATTTCPRRETESSTAT
ncbi:AMP-binding enzyme [Streptomyces sp. P1-3]|uniref:AMP-binding enzyme n=1 Tax=Streptomyces sp. P1-3 TaxID=3421658 RepID=UPI003D3621E5